jgi:hypothetical protein
MSLRTRIGILIVFIVVFLVSTPIVVLYTAGYRWNLKKQKIEKVGIVFLRSRPAGADIYLDGKLRREQTPARIRNLLPGGYKVTVSKKGYTSWSKQLSVESARTTFAERIALFREGKAEPLALAPSQALTADELAQLKRADPLIDRFAGNILRSDGFEISIEDKEGNRETVTRFSEEIRGVLAYDDGSWIIYQTENAIHAVERDSRDVRNDLTLATGEGMDGLAVSADGRTLYYVADQDGTAVLWRKELQ